MKKLSLVTAILLLVAMLVGCGGTAPEATSEDSSPVETLATEQAPAAPEQPVQVFDEKLVGCWCSLNQETQSAYLYSPLELHLSGLRFFLPDGSASLNNLTFSDAISANLPPMRLQATGGEIDAQAILDYLVSIQALTQEEADKHQNLRLSYSFRDLEWAELQENPYIDEELAPIYNENREDCLILHLTADYHKDALAVEKIDLTVEFYKAYSPYFDNFWHACLYGDWTDDRGNAWSFAFDNDGHFAFTMTEPDGTEHISRYIDVSAVHDGTANELGFLRFVFQDFSGPWYTVTACTADSISLHSESGDLTLTRN